MFFSAILSVLFLERKLVIFHWMGLFLCVLGLSLCRVFLHFSPQSPLAIQDHNNNNFKLNQTVVEQNNALNQDTSATDNSVFGILIILVGQIVCAVQYVVEEFVLKPPNDAPVLALVGIEGVWGTMLMAFLLPLMTYYMQGNDAFGSYENMFDTVYRLQHSEALLIFCVAFVVSVLVYNVAAVMVF